MLRFSEDGYAVFRGFKSREELAALRRRAEEIAASSGSTGQVSIFSTRDQADNSDEYFLTSGDKIRCFFEEDGKTVNKIGHAMHDLDPVFDRFSHDPRLAEIAARAGLPEPALYQSMYIFKQPRVGGVVDWHQDAAFLRTDPVSVTAFWFALDDADRTNGCLWVQPGGHRSPLRNQFVVRNGKAELQPLDPTPWPELTQAVPVEVEAGTLVVFNGLLPHYSAPNTSERPRHAYTLHALDGRAVYAPDNWLQRPGLPLRGFH
jgi:phytanoyl-CoA hydroxylase